MTEVNVGKGVSRVESGLKVTGHATYAADVPVANVAHAVIVSSAIAKGRLLTVDTTAAQAAKGVLLVLTHKNALKLPSATKSTGPVDRKLQLLQDDTIVYADQPIAVVVADTLERAQHAATLISVTYAAGVPVAELDGVMGTAYKPATAGPSGEPDSRRGDVDAAMASSAKSIDARYTTPVENHNPMEPHATIAVWQGDDRVTLYDATQGIFGVRKKISTVFDLPVDNVRVVNQYVGGGFGCKGSPWSHVVLTVMAAKVAGRPVKLALTRPQMFSLVGHRPKTVQRVALGADASGTLSAVRHDVTSETSSFDEFVEPSAIQTRMLYACKNVETSHRLVRIDVGTPTFMRAPGESTGTFALESAMDELAIALKMDPIALRIRNHADVDPEDGKPWSSKSLRECYKQGADRFGWARRTAEPRSMRQRTMLVGMGMATATYPARQSPSSAVARMQADGTLKVQAGSQDIGTGTYTIMSQIAADAAAIPYGRVRFELGDTTFPETPVSGGSQTASSTGSAVKMAGLALKARLAETAVKDRASPLFGMDPRMLDGKDGVLISKSDPGKKDPYEEIVKRSGKPEITADAHTEEKAERKSYATHSFGAQFVEVRVDPDLGTVHVTRVVSAFAAGKILNARTARSQFIGGVVWGIGLALTENAVRDAVTARVITRDLADYHVPVNADVPNIDIISVDEVDPYVNEIGAKGIGEIGITGISAAIANAVHHATGIRVRDLPITLDKVLREEA